MIQHRGHKGHKGFEEKSIDEGFPSVLDPVNAHLGAESLWRDWRAGRRDRLINLVLSGFLCGVLWELWNYWSRAKWHYSVPYVQRFHLFEMPLLGYAGYLPFGIECALVMDCVARIVERRALWPLEPDAARGGRV